MSNTIPRISSDRRLFALEGSEPIDQMHVERWIAQEKLSDIYRLEIIALSAEHDLPLEKLLGVKTQLLTTLADGTQTIRSGLVSSVRNEHTDGALTRYHLTLVPWLWILTQSSNSRVFQDLSVLEIIEQIFAAYRQHAKWEIKNDARSLVKTVRPRSYCVQYRETDFDFVQRLMAEEGLGYHFMEDDTSPSGHSMVIFGDSSSLDEDPTSIGGLRFHRSCSTENQDSVQRIGPRFRPVSSTVTLLSQDYKSRQCISASEFAISPREGFESFDPPGTYTFADSAEAGRYARLHVEAQDVERHQWTGHGTVRSARCGTRFRLSNAPWANLDEYKGQSEFLYTSVSCYGINNFSDDARAYTHPLDLDPFPPEVIERAEQTGFAQVFSATHGDRPWRATLSDGTGSRLNPRPTALGAQTAIVVGPDGNTTPGNGAPLYCDALGRVRIRFHWQAQHDLGGCWVRVSQVLTGNGHGAQFLPRIGHEVLVQFMDGDIDRPVIVKSLYNGRGDGGVAPTPGGEPAESDLSVYEPAQDHRPSAELNRTGGNSPAWHGAGHAEKHHRNAAALSGIKTQGFDGNGHNQLVFDDSDQQGRVQIASTHANSQLNLGHLIHQAGNYRGSFRGLGFELRTDAYGAIRAKNGLLLSTYATDPQTPAGDAIGAQALLEQQLEIARRFDQAALGHGTPTLATVRGVEGSNQSALIAEQSPLSALLTSLSTTVRSDSLSNAVADAPLRESSPAKGRVPHSGDALLTLSARDSLLQIAGQSLQHHAGETLTLGNGQDTHFATAEKLRIHSGQAIGYLGGATQANGVGMSLIAGEGPIDVQARQDNIRAQAQAEIRLMSVNSETELAAGKAIVLKVDGGASLTIEGGNITFACPGTMTVYAAEHDFNGPAQTSRGLPLFPESVCVECMLKAARSGAPFAELQ